MIPFPDKKYQIIYADPPWEFARWSEKSQRHVTKEYPTMTIEDIKALDVSKIATQNCALFLWVTFPNLPLGLDVIDAWGFRYSTVAFTWVKLNKKSGFMFFTPANLFLGMGYYTRSNAEICLLGIKGKPLERLSHSVRSIILSPKKQHSKKPPETRDRIIELFGDLPRIELFARETSLGWDAWGNETDRWSIPEEE